MKPDFTEMSAEIAAILDGNLGGWRRVAKILEELYEKGKADGEASAAISKAEGTAE